MWNEDDCPSSAPAFDSRQFILSRNTAKADWEGAIYSNGLGCQTVTRSLVYIYMYISNVAISLIAKCFVSCASSFRATAHRQAPKLLRWVVWILINRLDRVTRHSECGRTLRVYIKPKTLRYIPKPVDAYTYIYTKWTGYNTVAVYPTYCIFITSIHIYWYSIVLQPAAKRSLLYMPRKE